MMGLDYTHWHGTYELAKHFYTKFVPEIEELIEKGLRSSDDKRQKAADNLKTVLKDVLESDDHKWFIGKMNPEEKTARDKAAKEFKARYSNK